MFWNNYYNLCQQRGSSPNAVAKILNISSGAVSEWKKGRVPQMATLKKVADYFGVSPETLTAEPASVTTITNLSFNKFNPQLFGISKELDEAEQKWLDLFRSASDDTKTMMLSIMEMISDLDEADQKTVIRVVRSLGQE